MGLYWKIDVRVTVRALFGKRNASALRHNVLNVSRTVVRFKNFKLGLKFTGNAYLGESFASVRCRNFI